MTEQKEKPTQTKIATQDSNKEDYTKLNIYQKLLKIMEQVNYIQKQKEKVNNHYRFVSHDAVSKKTSEAFIKYGVYAKPKIIKNEITTIEVEKFKTINNQTVVVKEISFVCNVEVEYDFINVHKPDEKVTGINGLGQGIDNQDKACGKAISYACKYALLKAFGIETGEDPEKDVNYQVSTETINSDQVIEIENLCKQKGIDITIICKAYNINSLIELPDFKFSQVIKGLNKKPDFKNGVVNANN
jgi:hypothetical protein